jgi:hypothetical protein
MFGLPLGSTQTPIDARYKREGGGAGKVVAKDKPAMTPPGEEEGLPLPAAAPQPQNVGSDVEDAEYVREELRKLTRQASGEGSPRPAATADPTAAAQEEEEQKHDDAAVGAADAGAAAVELVEGGVEAAARKLGFGGGGEKKDKAW